MEGGPMDHADAVYPCIPAARLQKLISASKNGGTDDLVCDAFVRGHQLYLWHPDLKAYVGHIIHCPTLGKAPLNPPPNPPLTPSLNSKSHPQRSCKDKFQLVLAPGRESSNNQSRQLIQHQSRDVPLINQSKGLVHQSRDIPLINQTKGLVPHESRDISLDHCRGSSPNRLSLTPSSDEQVDCSKPLIKQHYPLLQQPLDSDPSCSNHDLASASLSSSCIPHCPLTPAINAEARAHANEEFTDDDNQENSPSSCLISPKSTEKQSAYHYLNKGIINSPSSSSYSSSASTSTSLASDTPTSISNRHIRFMNVLQHLATAPEAHFPSFIDVEDALSVLEIAHQKRAKQVIAACTNYLSAVSWSKGHAAQILIFFKRRKHIPCTGPLLKRLKMDLRNNADSSFEILKRIFNTLLSSIFDSYDNNGFSKNELEHIMGVVFSEKASERLKAAISSELYRKWNQVLPQLHRRGHVRDLHRPWICLSNAMIKHGIGEEAVAALSKGEMCLSRIREVIALEYAGMPEVLSLFDDLIRNILKSVMRGKILLPHDGLQLNLAKAATRALSLYQPSSKNGKIDKLHLGCEIVLRKYLSELPLDGTALFERSWQSLCKELDRFPWPDVSDIINGWRLIRGAPSLSNLL